MKVLALGGAGDMGRMGVSIMCEAPTVSLITVADKDYELAKTFTDLIGSEIVFLAKIDVNDREKLISLIISHDIVINTVGPFYKFAPIILDACIEAKRPYISIQSESKEAYLIVRLSEPE